jgi:hypothetical protein
MHKISENSQVIPEIWAKQEIIHPRGGMRREWTNDDEGI